MGSESLTTMVAGDSSFMIKTLYTFKLNGVSLNIDTCGSAAGISLYSCYGCNSKD